MFGTTLVDERKMDGLSTVSNFEAVPFFDPRFISQRLTGGGIRRYIYCRVRKRCLKRLRQ